MMIRHMWKISLSTLLIFYCVIDGVNTSHFRGGTIMVRPKLGGAPKEIEISYQISWTQSSSRSCDSSGVTNGKYIDYGGGLTCQYGCSGTILSTMSFICTYYSIEDNWVFGEYHSTYNFNNISVTDENTITIGYEGNAWINGIGGRWNISTTFSLVKRADTGKINSSPQILPTPPLRLKYGCSYTIRLPISDPDGDIIKCRWAVGDECKGICDKLPEATLHSDTCIITYTAKYGTGIKGVSVMVEDYAPGSLHSPLSSVALQFIILIYSSSQSCSSQIAWFRFPSITLHPSNKTVFFWKQSLDLTLTCMTNETSSYHWERQNSSVPSTAIGVNTSTLTLINAQPEDTGIYRCVAYVCSDCGRSFSHYAIVTVKRLPEMFVTPLNQSVEVSLTATFTAIVKGVGSFTYQWRKGRYNDIANETYSTFVIKEVSVTDQGYYTCYVTNNHGASVLSDEVFLQVTVNLPVIIKNPKSQSVHLKSNLTNVLFTCEADGASSYYWERQNGNIPSGAIGLTTNNLTIVNLQLKDAGYYRCVAINGSGSTESEYAKLTLAVSPSTIITQPTDTSAADPFSGVFTCSVEGYGYQNITWYKQSGTLPYKHKTNTMTSQGVATGTLIIPNVTKEDGGKYYCQVWANDIGIKSKPATLYLSAKPPRPKVTVLASQPIELTVNDRKLLMKCLPYDVNFNYKWERKNAKLPSTAQGVNSEQLTITNLKPKDSDEYRCIMSNSTGMIASDYESVTIKVALPVIVSQPVSTVTEVYDVAVFECTVRSYGSVSITWKRWNSKLPETAHITTSRSLNEAKSALRIEKSIGYYKGYYYCVIENIAGSVSSNYAYCNITVPCPQMIIPPEPVTVRPDTSVTFSCLAWSYGGLVYKWDKNDSLTLPSNSSVFFQDKSFPADTSCFTTVYELKIVNAQVIDEGLYCCVASNDCGNKKECAWLEVDTSPIITTQPKSQTFKDNEKNILTLWIIATGIGPIYYQWQKYNPFSNNWISPSSRADNITSPNLTFTVITEEDEGLYRCIASNDDGDVFSDYANIAVYGSPNITFYSSGIISFEGEKVILICNATNDEDAVDFVQISWYNRTRLLKSDGRYVTIDSKRSSDSDHIQSVLILDSVNNTDSGEYICRAFNNPFCYIEEKIKLTVEYAPRISINPARSPHMISVGKTLFLYCIAEGFPIPTIKWYKNHTLIPEQTSQVYLASTDTPGTTVYTCEGENNAGNMKNKARVNITVIVKEVIVCPTLSDPDNGKVFIYPGGTIAIFTCHSGFTTIGNPFLQCIDGKWNSPPPKCQPS